MPANLPWPMILTILVLLVTVVAFASGKFRSDIVALCALLSLVLLGIITPEQALSGFSSPVIVTIGGVFVVGGAIVRSGLATIISDRILKVAGANKNALFMVVMLLTAIVGSLVSNTGTVAIMMPIVVSMSHAIKESPSRFLMPLAFMSGMGGMLTLIGNPPNMVVNDVFVKAGNEPFTLFSFLPVGAVCLVFGMVVLAPATAWFLARRKSDKDEKKAQGLSMADLAEKYQLSRNMHSLEVPRGSSMIGRCLADLGLTGRFGVVVQEIDRSAVARPFQPARKEQIAPGPQTVIMAGDVLRMLGVRSNVEALAGEFGLFLRTPLPEAQGGRYNFSSIGICELVLMSSSELVGRTVADCALRQRFHITLLGIQRGDQYILDDLKDQVLYSGDALLVQGNWKDLAVLEDYSRHWVVVGRPDDRAGGGIRREKAPYVALIIALMIISMAASLLPTVVAVLIAAVLMLAGGCYSNVEEAYSAVNWETLIMIACMLPMAIAMENTGIVDIASRFMTSIGVEHGPFAALAVVYGVTSALNIIISSTPVSVLVAPVAMQIALDLGYSPVPFLFAVAAAASMCFASPYSTPSNALVMSAGRYTFLDYLKIGLPLQALMGVILVPALAWMFPF